MFAASQAVRDTFFGNVFQSTSFLFVAAVAFGLSTVLFGGWASIRKPGDVKGLWTLDFFWLNVTTAVAWLAYFFALRHLEPAIVNMIYVGLGPLTVLFWPGGEEQVPRLGGWEKAAYVGVAASLLGVVGVTVAGGSSLAGDLSTSAVMAVALGGISITVSHMIARRFNDAGVGSGMVFGSRFLLTSLFAVVAEMAFGTAEMRPDIEALPTIAFMAFVLIVLPSFSLQLGIARSGALAVNVIRALGPAFVFVAQQFDDRMTFSGLTLACICLFSISTVVASGLRTSDALRSRT